MAGWAGRDATRSRQARKRTAERRQARQVKNAIRGSAREGRRAA